MEYTIGVVGKTALPFVMGFVKNEPGDQPNTRGGIGMMSVSVQRLSKQMIVDNYLWNISLFYSNGSDFSPLNQIADAYILLFSTNDEFKLSLEYYKNITNHAIDAITIFVCEHFDGLQDSNNVFAELEKKKSRIIVFNT